MTPHGSPDPVRLTLYTVYDGPAVHGVAEGLRRWCEERSIPLQLEIVDLLKQPELASEARVFVTPTLVREAPLPERRVIGDLSEVATIMHLLQMPGSD